MKERAGLTPMDMALDRIVRGGPVSHTTVGLRPRRCADVSSSHETITHPFEREKNEPEQQSQDDIV